MRIECPYLEFIYIYYISSPRFTVCGESSQLSNSTKGDGIGECPGDIIIDIPSASCSTVKVSWKEPSFDDITDSIGIFSKSHSPGSSFPVNLATTVTYVFNDTARSSCSFDIEINGKLLTSVSSSVHCKNVE